MLLGGLYGAENSAQSQTRFDRPFAPQEGFVGDSRTSLPGRNLPERPLEVHAPEPIVERNIAEINEWVRITRECDHTRNWISGDGETQTDTDLPTVHRSLLQHAADARMEEQEQTVGRQGEMGCATPEPWPTSR